MRVIAIFALAALAFVTGSFLFGFVEGSAYGYWPTSQFRYQFEEWWLHAGRRLLPASVLALVLYRFAYPKLRSRFHLNRTWAGDILALIACFAVATFPTFIWAYIESLPLSFSASVFAASIVLWSGGYLGRAAA